MSEITLLDENFVSTDKKLEISFSEEAVNVPVVHQVVKATLASRRQGNASTKNRAFKMNRVNKKYVLKKEWQ